MKFSLFLVVVGIAAVYAAPGGARGKRSPSPQMPSPPMPPGMPKPPGMPFLTSLMEDSLLAHERVARQAPPQDAPKPPAMESSEHERFARQAPPAPPKRVARQADADNEVAEFESPLQIRQDAFYSTILKISRENKN